MSIVIRAENLGKAYKRYAAPTHRLVEWASLGHVTRHELIWALRGVGFEVSEGEAVGVVGRNAAGKTTLLQLLRGTLRPSEGRAEVAGEVASIDLGLGFHPELSGRENLFAASSLLGMSHHDLAERLPEIHAFAEIGDFLDQPVRVYSSGMRLRLAFALATARRPRLLFIDEALMVGDAYFQQKCFERIRRFCQQGTTLLLVSHDQAAVKNLCPRALLLDEGLLVRDGPSQAVLEYYNAMIARSTHDYEIRQGEALRGQPGSTRSGNGLARIERVLLLQAERDTRAFRVGETVVIQVEGVATEDIPDLTLGIAIRDRLGNEIFATNTHHLRIATGAVARGACFRGQFTLPLNLGVGSYTLTVAIHAGITHLENNYDWWDNVCSFQVLPGSEPRFGGSCYIPVTGHLETTR